MIRYALKCSDGHAFDSWFGSSADFDRLQAAGHVACAVCGSPDVTKAIMAPGVAAKGNKSVDAPKDESPAPMLSAPRNPVEKAIAELRAKVEASAENVGRNFAAEARAIHHGEATDRPIIGEAKPSEARELVEEGVPVLPLPWSTRRTN
ncbi:DUF1178 family protein [Oceanomicrobium pacificus]|uniref:DUF1178 family protein n=1 Tax=Oceanomicrobium pacificus TaxID=2692916 RepID=A0A6B0TS95_9RHOB|nr:DUF1178 family protein [Oceanomicrobium pacificus]MXU66866.1 DUF1178 family protein [Oceanomicrobium pacificus]